MAPRPPLPPFTLETAIQKVRLAEDGWNTRNPEKVSLAYTIDSKWRNRAEFPTGRAQIVAFLSRKWARELDYRLIKELWAFRENRIAVRFAYEYHDDSGNWFRAYGNENWEFDDQGLDVRATCKHQRTSDRSCRSQVSLAIRKAPGRAPRAARLGHLAFRYCRKCGVVRDPIRCPTTGPNSRSECYLRRGGRAVQAHIRFFRRLSLTRTYDKHLLCRTT
jgi:nuclear transport factor 2 (NTF2) superfamily protein